MYWIIGIMVVLVGVMVLINERKRSIKREDVMLFWRRERYLKVKIRGYEGYIKEERERSGDWENEEIANWRKIKEEVKDELVGLYQSVGLDYSIFDLR